MQPNEHPKFLEVLAGVHDFYGKDMSEFAGQVWIEAVKGFELQQVSKALSAHLMDPEKGQFMPKPADLVRQLQGTNTDRSLIAWGKALAAASSVGAYSDVAFDDPAIHAAIEDLGGWPKLCRCGYEEIGYMQHRFCESYRAYAGRGTFDYPARLTGARDSDEVYRKHGLPLPKAKLIGDREACIQVIERGGAAKALTAENPAALVGGALKVAA